jgi:dTDP-4-amino-4,6-dideoxygalactose transaminase
VFYVYVVQVRGRDLLYHHLLEQGIGCGIHYPTPIHLQPACQQYGYSRGSFPVTEAACERILSLPMYPELTGEQLHAVIDGVKQGVIDSATVR